MTKYIIFISVLLLAMLVSCTQDQNPMNPSYSAMDGQVGEPQDVSGAAQILSVYLNVYVVQPNGQTVNLHQITSDWDPGSVTWGTFSGAYSPEIEGSFAAAARQWYAVEITDLFIRWLSDESSNYGVLLEQAPEIHYPAMIHSLERTGYGPFLEISYISGAATEVDTVMPQVDLFIDQLAPNSHIDGSMTLMIGHNSAPESEKQTLMRFDIPDLLYEVSLSAVGGSVWNDESNDGVYDDGEHGLTGVTVNLLDCDGAILESVLTDPAGDYSFDSLAGGSYVLEFIAPEKFVFSLADQGTNDTLDSDADPATGQTACFALADGDSSMTWSAGVFIPDITDSGCTRSKGYWKNHAGFGPQDDELSTLLPIWLGNANGVNSLQVTTAADAVDVLSMKSCSKSASNGFGKLYAHLLAAKLNIANGAIDVDIADVIADADDMLTDHSCSDWRSLSKEERELVQQWSSSLDDYNSGLIGPGSCDRVTDVDSMK